MIVLIGPSGSNKNEIAKALFKYKNMSKVITATTRKPRPYELSNSDYYFVSETKFNDCVAKGKFIETSSINGYYYGTPLSELDDNKVLIISPDGLKNIVDKLPSESLSKTCIFYIKSKKAIREENLIQRGFTYEEASKIILENNYTYKNIKVNFIINLDRLNTRVIASKIYFLYQLFLSGEVSSKPSKIVKNA